jgi:citrate lyase beta subunit
MATLPDTVIAALTARLGPVDTALADRFPGEPSARQPVHTCYVPADQVRADIVDVWRSRALHALDTHSPQPAQLAEVTGTAPAEAEVVYAYTRRMLAAEPIQDLRVDLEDGYGTRDDATEDDHAASAAQALLEASVAGHFPASYGLRPKSLAAGVRARGLRSLDIFFTTLAGRGRRVPPGLVITLPKVDTPEQISVFIDVLAELEHRLHLPETPIEVQVETPAAVLCLPTLIAVGRSRGRLVGLHIGTYDYTAALGITAGYQASDHPAVEFATTLMQLTAAGTGIRVADGSSNLLPVGDTATVRAAWRRHADIIRRAWARGLYQGWDLHPAQLVSRHATVASCLLAGLPAALARLAAETTPAGPADSGAVADEPATLRALANHVQRALDTGLLDDTGLTAAGLDRPTLTRLTHPTRN